VWLKVGHTANVCWYRFDEEYVDSGATYHITGELEKLTMHDRYNGNDQIRAANSAGMDINHIGQSVIPTSSRPLHLNHVLHVPHAHKQIVSIHRFALDNNTFIELHQYFFLIKDQVLKKVLLHGQCRGGLYPLPDFSSPVQKLILSSIRSSSRQWHCRLGHLSSDIVL
jgi:hypothetical protein